MIKHMIPLLLFGMVVGSILHWIQPERNTGGYVGAALLGSVGAVLGSVFAISAIESISSQSFIFPSLLLMTIGLFTMLAPRKLIQ